jgi:predicted transcriptional regulator
MACRRCTRDGAIVEQVTTRIPLDVLAWLDETARKRGESRSQIIARAITYFATRAPAPTKAPRAA